MGFAGKVVLVAGGTGGLGRAVSLAFLNEDAKLIITYRHDQEFAHLQSAAGSSASRIGGRQVDLTAETAVQELIVGIVAEHGRLDVLVNTVGGYTGGKPLWEIPPRDLDRMLALNLRPGFLLARAAANVMRKQGSGVIVNVASKAAVDHGAGAAAYSASKAAALAMIDSLAADLEGSGVRVNSVLPSIIDTESNRQAMPRADFSKWPKPADIARVILFLCSDDAKVIHGAAIPVYGSS
ncbi:MAG TPA: SDR family NAD(P)-dependent oxidoreductase [Bryobacteraceae bacterium]|nr:SDR family NAD(P)-dependent oxidoreductase [Bryobacteraceae bacterium]